MKIHELLRFLPVLMLSSLPASAEIRVTDCLSGLGPEQGNLAVLVDTQDHSLVREIGYQSGDHFFALQLVGCAGLKVVGSALVCVDGRLLGSVKDIWISLDEPLREGVVVSVELDPRSYRITGSCQDRLDPLTLTVR